MIRKASDISDVWVISNSSKETFKLGKKLSRFLKAGDILLIYGPLGAGKTVFVKGLAEGLGISENDVKSPAFVLIHEYGGRVPLYHIDFYRIEDTIKEIMTTGFHDYLYNNTGIVIVEWAQRLKNYPLLANCLKVEFEIIGKNIRRINFYSDDKRYKLIVDKIKKKR